MSLNDISCFESPNKLIHHSAKSFLSVERSLPFKSIYGFEISFLEPFYIFNKSNGAYYKRTSDIEDGLVVWKQITKIEQ